jgi:hypothetical protein
MYRRWADRKRTTDRAAAAAPIRIEAVKRGRKLIETILHFIFHDLAQCRIAATHLFFSNPYARKIVAVS